ncbi:MAG TPA: hypothetical protein VF525_11885 [Pyrinomonadaceae bacterium]|jgi:hypothetical protein
MDVFKFKTVVIGVLLCVCALFLATAAWSSLASNRLAGAQAAAKIVETDPPIFNEPIRVAGVKVGQRSVKFGEKLAGDKDWLKGSEFKLTNISGKGIVFVELDVNLPETRRSGPEMSYRINLGQLPQLNLPLREPIYLAPGGELNVTLDEKRYEQLNRLVLQRHTTADINKVRVLVGFVVFEDGLAWSAGSFYRQDPNNPKAWKQVTNEEAAPPR